MARTSIDHQITAEARLRRLYVGWASGIALCMVAIVAIAGNHENLLRAASVFLGFGLPFLTALASILAPLGITARRMIWLACGLTALVPSFFFIWNGTGFFLGAVALTYLWAAWGAGREPDR